MKIFDCTTYFNEPLIMDVRFNILNEHVSKFIIVESAYSHSGAKKKINFDKNLYPQFKDKIKHIIVDKEPENILDIDNTNIDIKKRMNSILRISLQRNEALKACKEASEEDYIFYSDNDEIPNFNDINFIKNKSKFIIFEQKLFYYKFNLLNDRIFWYGTKGAKKKYIKSISDLRHIKPKKYPIWRIDTLFSKNKFSNLKIIKNGGWHFTQLKKPEDLFEKIKNDEHHNEFDKLNINIDHIKNMIDNKFIEYDHLSDSTSTSKIGNRFKLKSIDINSNMPIYLKKNVKKYEDWFDFDFKNI
jgi:beta-1,4-mannosyl-glycoprotein beta-1,4-N-acetylglucosaminyltransferase